MFTLQLNGPSAPAPDELYYASIRFSKNQEDPLYSNIGEAQPNRHKNEEEEEEEQEGAVEYTLVNFKRASPGWVLEDFSLLHKDSNSQRFYSHSFIAVPLSYFKPVLR